MSGSTRSWYKGDALVLFVWTHCCCVGRLGIAGSESGLREHVARDGGCIGHAAIRAEYAPAVGGDFALSALELKNLYEGIVWEHAER